MNAQRHTVSSATSQRARSLGIAGSTLGLIFLGVIAAATPAYAQNQPQSPSDRYQVESAGCYNGRSRDDGPVCLKEANAALDEDRKGKLTEAGLPHQQNATPRCQALPAADKVDFEKRTRGDEWAIGNVELGRIQRELVVHTPVASK